ncbi:hypothetical protein [Sorangium sp. So ce1078]|uniref:hypothetical protein n=1 Tax=Sorangium sp. So ce1078 TaxID=3133329 RepID=UPI003F6060B6
MDEDEHGHVEVARADVRRARREEGAHRAATSSDIKLEPAGKGRFVLTAKCTKLNGAQVSSRLDYDIANNDGVLQWAPHGIGR